MKYNRAKARRKRHNGLNIPIKYAVDKTVDIAYPAYLETESIRDRKHTGLLGQEIVLKQSRRKSINHNRPIPSGIVNTPFGSALKFQPTIEEIKAKREGFSESKELRYAKPILRKKRTNILASGCVSDYSRWFGHALSNKSRELAHVKL